MAMTVAALIAVVPMAACAQQIDTTVSAPPNARVEIQNFAGTVVVRTWDRPAVRVVSAQGRRDDVRIRGDNGVVSRDVGEGLTVDVAPGQHLGHERVELAGRGGGRLGVDQPRKSRHERERQAHADQTMSHGNPPEGGLAGLAA